MIKFKKTATIIISIISGIIITLIVQWYLYKGCIYGDCKNGHGVYRYMNEDTYTGKFKDGKKEGAGSIQLSNGEVLKGYFHNDEFVEPLQ